MEKEKGSLAPKLTRTRKASEHQSLDLQNKAHSCHRYADITGRKGKQVGQG
jgi:hypothetical protein